MLLLQTHSQKKFEIAQAHLYREILYTHKLILLEKEDIAPTVFTKNFETFFQNCHYPLLKIDATFFYEKFPKKQQNFNEIGIVCSRYLNLCFIDLQGDWFKHFLYSPKIFWQSFCQLNPENLAAVRLKLCKIYVEAGGKPDLKLWDAVLADTETVPQKPADWEKLFSRYLMLPPDIVFNAGSDLETLLDNL